MAAQKAAGLMAKGGGDGSNQYKAATGVSDTPVADKPITLDEAGIDKHLANRARNEAAKSEEEFEVRATFAKRQAVASVDETAKQH